MIPLTLLYQRDLFVCITVLSIRQVDGECLCCLLNVLYYIKFLLILQNALDIRLYFMYNGVEDKVFHI